jgi:hypothetical protein
VIRPYPKLYLLVRRHTQLPTLEERPLPRWGIAMVGNKKSKPRHSLHAAVFAFLPLDRQAGTSALQQGRPDGPGEGNLFLDYFPSCLRTYKPTHLAGALAVMHHAVR